MPLHKDTWWLVGSAVAAIAAAPLFVQGDAQATARRRAAAQKIERLSPAERQKLEENFRRFQQLPPAEQARYREIHARIQENPAVAEALDAFSQWWPSVSAREQAQLFRQADVKERIAVVSQIQEEIDRDRAARVYVGRGWGRGEWQRPETSLSRDSFYQIMQTLEALASESYVLRDELPEIQMLDPFSPQRYLKLITALHQKQQSWSSLVSDPASENRIIESVSDDHGRELVRQRIGDRFPGSSTRGGRLRIQLVMTLAKELYLEGLKQNLGEKELRKKLDSLSEEDKAELYSSTGEDARAQLRSRVHRDMRAAFKPVWDFFQIGPGSGDGRGRDSSSRRD